jgi:hypothetical protein
MPTMPEIHAAMAEVTALQQQLESALKAQDSEEVDKVLTELTVAEKRRNRLLQRAADTTGPGFDTAPPVREQVAAALRILSRPASVSLIRDVAGARFGEKIQASRLASLRRDEQRSWLATHRPGGSSGRSLARPVYIIPALTYDRFAPVRGMLALSSWSLETRLVAPASPRVDILHVILRLVDELEHSADAPWAPDVRRLVWRFGRSVAGAIEGRGEFTYAQVRDAAERELRQIAEGDTAERREAAERARSQLDEETMLFGVTLRSATNPNPKKATG